VIRGTLAYWRLRPDGVPVPHQVSLSRDLSGNGNDLHPGHAGHGSTGDMTYTQEFPPGATQPGEPLHQRLHQNPAQGGAYLRTADKAPLNSETFKRLHLEAFVRMPEDCCGDKTLDGCALTHGSRRRCGPTSGPQEPLVTADQLPSPRVSMAVAPFSNPDLVTDWSFRTPT